MTILALLVAIIVIGLGVGVWWFASGDSQDTSSAPRTTLTRESPVSLTFIVSEEPHLSYPNESRTVDTVWGDVGIVFTNLSESGTIWRFLPTTESLIADDGQSTTVDLFPEGVVSSPYWVNCSVSDQTGNGLVNEGDSFTLILDGFTLEPGSGYVVSMKYLATDSAMAECELTG